MPTFGLHRGHESSLFGGPSAAASATGAPAAGVVSHRRRAGIVVAVARIRPVAARRRGTAARRAVEHDQLPVAADGRVVVGRARLGGGQGNRVVVNGRSVGRRQPDPPAVLEIAVAQRHGGRVVAGEREQPPVEAPERISQRVRARRGERQRRIRREGQGGRLARRPGGAAQEELPAVHVHHLAAVAVEGDQRGEVGLAVLGQRREGRRRGGGRRIHQRQRPGRQIQQRQVGRAAAADREGHGLAVVGDRVTADAGRLAPGAVSVGRRAVGFRGWGAGEGGRRALVRPDQLGRRHTFAEVVALHRGPGGGPGRRLVAGGRGVDRRPVVEPAFERHVCPGDADGRRGGQIRPAGGGQRGGDLDVGVAAGGDQQRKKRSGQA